MCVSLGWIRLSTNSIIGLGNGRKWEQLEARVVTVHTQEHQRVEQVIFQRVPPRPEHFFRLGPTQDLALQIFLQRGHVVVMVVADHLRGQNGLLQGSQVAGVSLMMSVLGCRQVRV